jgi:hypothetical protein
MEIHDKGIEFAGILAGDHGTHHAEVVADMELARRLDPG